MRTAKKETSNDMSQEGLLYQWDTSQPSTAIERLENTTSKKPVTKEQHHMTPFIWSMHSRQIQRHGVGEELTADETDGK